MFEKSEIPVIWKFNKADWKHKKLFDLILEFEEDLDADHDIAIRLVFFGTSTTMLVTNLSFQNPDIFYFCGYINEKSQNWFSILVN